MYYFHHLFMSEYGLCQRNNNQDVSQTDIPFLTQHYAGPFLIGPDLDHGYFQSLSGDSRVATTVIFYLRVLRLRCMILTKDAWF